jgi:Rad3-related DNA helicase
MSEWSLLQDGKKLEPLVFSNGKSQEDIVQEIIEEIEQGHKVIFIKGVCGSGKSVIALNLSKRLGKSSIVVPVKALQKQYEQDYTDRKYLTKEDGERLKISVITGRANHFCPFLQEQNKDKQEKELKTTETKLSEFNTKMENIWDKSQETREIRNKEDESANNAFLPCKIQIKDKNKKKIREYIKKNPKVKVSNLLDIDKVRRLSIAPVCPYWSPVVPSEVDLKGVLDDANCQSYEGLNGKKYIIYKRKSGCSYYEQFDSYIDSDVIIFNSQKYKLETLMDRKPLTDVEIIDECDEFLDNFSNYKKINLNFLNFSLGNLITYNKNIEEIINEIRRLTKKLMANFKYRSGEIINIKDTSLYKILKLFFNSDFMNHVECDEENYCYHCDEVARTFQDLFDETYVSFDKDGRDFIVRIVTTNLEKRFREILDKNKIIIMMSGTIHSRNVLENIFGLKNFKIVEAETKTPGKITIKRTGKEINCRYQNFKTGKATRKQYLFALSECIKKAEKPILVHVNSFKDLPTELEKQEYNLDIISKGELKERQFQDKTGKEVMDFKQGKIDILYTTKCNRGADFPGDTCKSIIITKYPYPDVSSLFWQILKKTNPKYYMRFYMDKAERELLQRIYRGLRSRDDHIYLLSPDSRVLDRLNI